MTALLPGVLVYHGFVLAHRNLSDHLDLLNMINVFPIADKDTGSNMEQSMSKVASGLPYDESATRLFASAADILLQSGRGNSGTILTLFFEGLADSLAKEDAFTPKSLANAMTAGASFARNGIENPRDGTILTVSEKAALAGCRTLTENEDISLSELMKVMADAAYAALPMTAKENPDLQKYGVIDSGAFGFCMILDAFAAAYRGEDAVDRSYEELAEEAVGATAENSDYKYCTELVVKKPKDGYDNILKEELERLGDCIIPVMDKNRLKLHIHTNQPEAVLFVASLCGNLEMTKIDNMTLQNGNNHEVRVFYCKEKLTKDGLLSMGNEDVFCLEETESEKLQARLRSLFSEYAAVTLYSSITLPPKTEEGIKKIRYFDGDASLMDYLFSETC